MGLEQQLGCNEVIETLAALMTTQGIPEHLRSDNGPDFIARALRAWLKGMDATPLSIEPGSPWENGYCESFNGKLPDECLNGEISTRCARPRSSSNNGALSTIVIHTTHLAM